MRKYISLLLAVFFVAMQVDAQDTPAKPLRDASTQKKYTFAQHPLQIFNWGWRSDFEMRLGKGPGWLQFGPAVYFAEKNNSNYYYDRKNYYYEWGFHLSLREPFSKMIGGGLDINYKHFINTARTFYCAVGLSYTYFEIEYRGKMWQYYIEDGLQYYESVSGVGTQYINRLGVQSFCGYQIPTRRAFLFDVFCGLAYRRSYSDNNKPSFNESMFSYGYSGIVFLTGIRLGFGLRERGTGLSN